MDSRLTALEFLISAGWRGTPLGDPRDPDALLYIRRMGDHTDAVLVFGPDQAVAKRVSGGQLAWQQRGTVTEVVSAVLDLPLPAVACEQATS